MQNRWAALAAGCGAAAAALTAGPLMARGDVKVEKVAYLNLPNCYRMSNGTVELIFTTDMGPRVLRYGFMGDENVFAELPDQTVKTEYGEFRIMGGHRLWTAPEAWPRSYEPDSAAVDMKTESANAVRLTEAVEPHSGIQKEMVISMDAEGTGVSITHRLTNRNNWAVDVACWAMSVMRGGGQTIIPQEPYVSHDDSQNGLLPARALVLWPFTDMSDPRWTFGKRYLRLKTDDNIKESQKIGIANKQGWAAYHRAGTLFVKRYAYDHGATYPDGGCNTETYTAGPFMELESLGPMRHLNWGETAEHVERWSLFKNVDVGQTEATLDAALSPVITRLGR